MSYFEYNGRACYYEEEGKGTPLLLLHGNTASSVMFQGFVPDFAAEYKTVLIDFLGHGKSDRLERFCTDLWFDEAQQVIAFLEYKGYSDVSLLGSSGGAIVAMNAALERPDLIRKVVADSFEGEHALAEFTANLEKDREASKLDPNSMAFYEAMHGAGWEQVVDCDTRALVEHSRRIGAFFHRPLSHMKADVLLTGSREDEFVSFIKPDFFEETYSRMIADMGRGEVHIFEHGCHPAALSNGQAFLDLVMEFLGRR